MNYLILSFLFLCLPPDTEGLELLQRPHVIKQVHGKAMDVISGWVEKGTWLVAAACEDKGEVVEKVQIREVTGPAAYEFYLPHPNHPNAECSTRFLP